MCKEMCNSRQFMLKESRLRLLNASLSVNFQLYRALIRTTRIDGTLAQTHLLPNYRDTTVSLGPHY